MKLVRIQAGGKCDDTARIYLRSREKGSQGTDPAAAAAAVGSGGHRHRAALPAVAGTSDAPRALSEESSGID